MKFGTKVHMINSSKELFLNSQSRSCNWFLEIFWPNKIFSPNKNVSQIKILANFHEIKILAIFKFSVG